MKALPIGTDLSARFLAIVCAELSICFHASATCSGVIGIAGGIPAIGKRASLPETTASVFHLAESADEYYPPARVENYDAQLRQRAPDVEFRSYDAGMNIDGNAERYERLAADPLEIKIV
jgi:predicted esterase